MSHYHSDEEIQQLAMDLISDREQDMKDVKDVKWYTAELDEDEETQSRVYVEVVWLLGLNR
jgi:hypothetical protein